jgi:hypothetical protein
MEEVHYGGEGQHWAVVPMKKNNTCFHSIETVQENVRTRQMHETSDKKTLRKIMSITRMEPARNEHIKQCKLQSTRK